MNKISGDTVTFNVELETNKIGVCFLSLRNVSDDESYLSKSVKVDYPLKNILVKLEHKETKNLLGEYLFEIRFKDSDNNVNSYTGFIIFEAPIVADLDA